MILLLICGVCACVELAGWVMDGTFAARVLGGRQIAQAEDVD